MGEVDGGRDGYTVTYSETVNEPESARPTLLEEAQGWLDSLATDHDPTTVRHYGIYLRAHFTPHFRWLAGITTATARVYLQNRLKKVLDQTVEKELSALRSLLAWAHEQGLIKELPTIAGPPRRATGTPDTRKPHKVETVELTEAEVEKLIAAMPERSPGSHNGHIGFWLRAYFEALWYTGLRPATLAEIEFPRDYKRGSAVLKIRDECDKCRLGRELPLCEEARAALDRVCPQVGSGLIFGSHDYRKPLRRAATLALAPEKATKVSAYDFRHARLTWLCERTNNLVGVCYLSGHKRVDTLASRYVHPNRSAAASVIRATQKQLTFTDLLDPTDPKGGAR